MARLRSPLASLQATGRLMSHLSFLRRRHTDIVENTPIPTDAKTLAQLSWRHMYQKAVALWHGLSDAEKQEWESLARPFHMTGFAYFISQALKPNPGLYLPLQGGKMSGDIDMDGNKIEDIPDPTNQQDPITKQYFEDNLPVGGYTEGARAYHNVNVSIPNTTLTVVPLNSERWDTDVVHDNVVNNSRLTCKTAGKYLIIGNSAWAANAVGRRLAIIMLNGVNRMGMCSGPTTVAGLIFQVVTTIYILAVNDYVEFEVYQNSGAALNLLAYTERSPEFMMSRIG